MNFTYKGRSNNQERRRLQIDSFLGVDFASSKINANKNRATDMLNFIHKDGVNHKRKGWNEIAKFEDIDGNAYKINGFWEYTDTEDIKHILVHAGNKLFRITKLGKNSFETVKEDISNNLEEYILDKRSFGVVKGDWFYWFAGNKYLMYGKWNNGLYELREVENGEKTYIPTTSIGISAEGSNLTARYNHDEINLLRKKRRNKLIGEPEDEGTYLQNLKGIKFIDDLGRLFFRIKSETRPFKNAIGCRVDFINIETGYNVKTKYFKFSSYLRPDPSTYGYIPFSEKDTNGDSQPIEEYADYLEANFSHGITFSPKVDYKDGMSIDATFKVIEGYDINIYLIKEVKYQLDTTNISNVKVWINGELKTAYTDYFGDNQLISSGIDTTNGTITFQQNFPPTLEGESNIIVEFEKVIEGNADKINKCQFGASFGIGDVEDLFVSGNPDNPNYDYHSSYPDSSETQSNIPANEDLTYFGDLGYAIVGNRQSKIVGYSLLEDGTLAIFKEENKGDPHIYLRTARLDNVTDVMGNAITDLNGNPYQKVIYPQYAGSMGEGMLTRFATCNLAGEKLFLSRNGIYSVVLNANIKSNERYARERSRLINPRLTNEKDLQNASAISFNNRIYLSVNGNCYIGDSRFKNQLNAEMDDAYSFEYWFWNNLNARIWFIYNNQLAFGTDKGQLCIFEEDNAYYEDKTYVLLKNGDLILDLETNTFTINERFDETISKLKEGDSLRIVTEQGAKLGELVLEPEDIESVVNGVVKVSFDAYVNKVRFLEYNEVYLDNLEGYTNIAYVIKNLNADDLTFELHIKGETEEDELDTTLNTTNFALVHLLENEDVYLQNIDYELGTFKLSTNILDSDTGLVGTKELYSYPSSLEPIQAQNLKGYFNIRDYIVSHWESPIFDLGSAEYSKNIYSITITPEPIIGGEVTFGFRVKDKREDFSVEGTNLFDFNTIDFTNFTFETSTFAKSFTKKIRVRNANFLMFYFRSENDKDSAINSMSITYEYGKLNKGVR